MSMDRDLRNAIPETPESCRAAVLRATGTYQEETTMRKPYKLILAVALIAALLCGTAYAVVNHYSVRDYVAKGQTSAAFEESIVPLDESVTAGGLTFTLGDAIFDGRNLALAMNIDEPAGTESLLIVPELTAWDGDKALETEIAIFTRRYEASAGYEYGYTLGQSGLFSPPREPMTNYATGRMGLKALLSDAPAGEVTWRYTLHLFRPVGEIVKVFSFDERSNTYGLWMDSLRLMHSRGQIGAANGWSSLEGYVEANATVENQPYHQFYEEDPLFEKVDAVTFEFTTPVMELPQKIAGETFAFEDVTVVVNSFSQSVMQLNFELDVHCWFDQMGRSTFGRDLTLIDQSGTEIPVYELEYHATDDVRRYTVTGEVVYVSDEPLTELTFRFSPFVWEPAESLVIPEFTLDLDQ